MRFVDIYDYNIDLKQDFVRNLQCFFGQTFIPGIPFPIKSEVVPAIENSDADFENIQWFWDNSGDVIPSKFNDIISE